MANIRLLGKADRCDRCSAAAQIALLFNNTSELMFCGHHMAKYSDALVKCDPMIAGADERLMEACK